ncbi:hypothetical protein ZIOFF_070293 [Zingiber officinale]|uniref:Dolichyl-diphosphooligosaccharide--protein glycosyltransferase subunit 1 n=1 Tax=Zingiber officinale TaxID=94328 RepID=A0A8J5C5E3_ZINOF|nr:hypothetical protein ZIOFF_070293 [Zingiber officinale]
MGCLVGLTGETFGPIKMNTLNGTTRVFIVTVIVGSRRALRRGSWSDPDSAMATSSRFAFFLFCLSLLYSTALSDLVISRFDRRVSRSVSLALLLADRWLTRIIFPRIRSLDYIQVECDALVTDLFSALYKSLCLAMILRDRYGGFDFPRCTDVVLVKGLGKGGAITLDVLTVFTHSPQPFSEEISQAEVQLVLYQDSAYYLSPYKVKMQTLGWKVYADSWMEEISGRVRTRRRHFDLHLCCSWCEPLDDDVPFEEDAFRDRKPYALSPTPDA